MKQRKKLKCDIYRDSMQNYKKYAIPPAQLIIADVPYNVGNNFYGSNPMWYVGGIIRTVKVNLQRKQRSIRILISIYMSIFIFAQRC
jgi:site-specific DNA-methyltransferase (adenine-specific)